MLLTLWITPRLAVAVNFAQFVALANHSKLSLSKKILIKAKDTIEHICKPQHYICERSD